MYNRFEEDFENDMFYAEWQAQDNLRAHKSYPEGVEHVYCPYCGELLFYNSISYYEGYHIECAH